MLTWSATHATSCTASGAWSGAKAATGGSQSTGALTANQTYTLTCSGTGGSAAQSAAVTVTTPAPAVTLTANPATVKSGATSALSLVLDQCDRLHRLGRLERRASDRWFTDDAGSHGDHEIYADLHGRRRLGVAVRHGLLSRRPPAPTVSHQRQSFERRQRQRIDPDLELDQCHQLHRIGRMERLSGDQRFEVHRRPECDHGVYAELHGHGRHEQSKRDRDGDREQQRNGDPNLGAAHAKYRWITGHDADRIPHLLRHVRGLD